MARFTRGRLYKRGKQGRYYLQYYVNGKEFKAVLRDENGEPITTEAKAKKAAELILAPIRYRNDAQRLQAIVNELSTVEDKADAADADLKNKTATLANGWKAYTRSPSCPDCCSRYSTVERPTKLTRAYERNNNYFRFVAWIGAKYPTALLFSDVTEDIASEYYEHLKSSHSACSVNSNIADLKRIFATLMADEKITMKRNPFGKIRPIPRHPNSKKPLTVEQIGRLIQTATGEMRVFVALGYFSGLRRSDCATLLWREVDLIRGVIERIPNKMRDRVRDPEQVKVKVGINPFLMNLLLDIPGDRSGYVLPGLAARYEAQQTYHIARKMNQLFQDCGIETHRAGTGKAFGTRPVVEIGFHSLRYSYISHNAEAGTPAAIIQRNAGHANPAMTESYVKISDAAAVKYATALRLPAPETDTAEVIDVSPTEKIESEAAEPEREELRKLADSLTVEEIKEILLRYKK